MLRIKLPDNSFLRTTVRTVVDQRTPQGVVLRDHREIGFTLETGGEQAVCSPEAAMVLLEMASRIRAGADTGGPEAGGGDLAEPGAVPDAKDAP